MYREMQVRIFRDIDRTITNRKQVMIVTELERCNLRRRTIFEWKMHNNLQRKIKTEEMEHDEGEMKMLMK